jgi:hypothetical protein
MFSLTEHKKLISHDNALGSLGVCELVKAYFSALPVCSRRRNWMDKRKSCCSTNITVSITYNSQGSLGVGQLVTSYFSALHVCSPTN